jgi:hypothetical protein
MIAARPIDGPPIGYTNRPRAIASRFTRACTLSFRWKGSFVSRSATSSRP